MIPELLLLACLSALPARAASPEERGLEIALSVEKANDGFLGEEAELEMVLYNAHGDKIARRMRSRTLEVPGDGDKSVMTFSWPADVKGTRMLTWSHKKGDDDQWLYLPAIKRVKRISARGKTGSFMGSEFAYEDLGSQEPEKYAHKHLEDLERDGRALWRVERRPLEDSGYSRQVLEIDREYMGPARIEYYDRKGELLKTAEFGGYAKHGKHWRPATIDMRNHQTRKRSVIDWKRRSLGKRFPDGDFDSRSLDEL